MKYILLFLWPIFSSCLPKDSTDLVGLWCGSSGPTPYAVFSYLVPKTINDIYINQDSVKLSFSGKEYIYLDEPDTVIILDSIHYVFDTGSSKPLNALFGDTSFENGDVAKKYKSGESKICYYDYSANHAIIDTITNISLVTLKPFGKYSTSDTLNQDLTIGYTQWAGFISSGYTLEAYNNAKKTIPLEQFNQQKNILVDPSSVTLHFKSPLPTGSYSFQLRYSTARGKVLTKDLDMVVE